MVHLDSASLDEYLLNLEHAKQKMSRRLLLRRMTGLMLVSSSLIPLTTACSAVTNAPPATTSSAPRKPCDLSRSQYWCCRSSPMVP